MYYNTCTCTNVGGLVNPTLDIFIGASLIVYMYMYIVQYVYVCTCVHFEIVHVNIVQYI